MYRIFGAIAIVGLFLLGSASTGLAVVGAIKAPKQAQAKQVPTPEQDQGQQMSGQQQKIQIPMDQIPDIVNWNGLGPLPHYDGDGQDGGLTYGDSYPLPAEYGLPAEFTTPFPLGIFNKPQYVVYYIAVKRIDKSQQFKAVIANVGTPAIGPCNHAIIVFKCGLPVGWNVQTKAGILVPFLGLRVVESSQVWGRIGNTVVVITDFGQDVNEMFDLLGFIPRVRRFVSNRICSYSSLLYPALLDFDPNTIL
jgi:hypothetical protein